jgi:hypothetical protein
VGSRLTGFMLAMLLSCASVRLRASVMRGLLIWRVRGVKQVDASLIVPRLLTIRPKRERERSLFTLWLKEGGGDVHQS